jgi:NAD(P)-dependent dehydrogenase (short-subunit alcohol dehydrogenase family)
LFFSYTASVILLSLAMYGIWYCIRDLWKWWLEPRLLSVPSCSFLIVVRNLDYKVEDMLRYLAHEIEEAEIDCDIVVVDVSSDDLTAAILERLAENISMLRVVVFSAGMRPASEAIALCRGAVVHVMDLANRMSVDDFMVAVCGLLRQDYHNVMVKRVGR